MTQSNPVVTTGLGAAMGLVIFGTA